MPKEWSSDTPRTNGQLLHCLKRGLAGYVSYLAACQMNEAYSEYMLYEPTLRILTALGCRARCEVPCIGLRAGARGDQKRLDFVVTRGQRKFALEMKWVKGLGIRVAGDLAKLRWFLGHHPTSEAYLCVFGRKSHLKGVALPQTDFTEVGEAVIAEFGNTRYGCRMFRASRG